MSKTVIIDDIHITDDKAVKDISFFLLATVEDLNLALYFQGIGINNGQIRNDHPGHQDILFSRNINGKARGGKIINIQLNFFFCCRVIKSNIRQRGDLDSGIA